jgi:multiple sugar transport system permease protein
VEGTTRAPGWRLVPLLLPALVWLTVFTVGPAVVSAVVAGTNKSLLSSDFSWIGLTNARDATHDSDLGRAVRNTLLYCVITVIPAVVIGLTLALAANRLSRGRSVVAFALFLPASANLVAMSVVFAYIFNDQPGGLANTVIGWFGAAPKDWLGDTSTALPVVALVGLWRLTSFIFVVYLAGLTAIPVSVYEAAAVDGVRGWARLRRLTLPLLTPSTVFVVVFSTILTLQTFETVSVLTQGGPLGSSATLVYYMYQVGFTGSFRIGYASMLALLMFLVIALLGGGGALLGRRARRRLSAAERVTGVDPLEIDGAVAA